MVRVLRNSYHWPARPPTSERSNARCVSIQQGSAVHRCAYFISLSVWLRSQFGYSKHQHFIESSNEPNSDTHADPNSDATPDSYTDSHADSVDWSSGAGA